MTMFQLGLALLAAAGGASAASSKMDYLPFAHVRTDPVINRDCLSDHVHTYYGAVIEPWPTINHTDLRSACSTSGNVEENKSLYWHPTIYKVLADGTHERATIGFSTAYYIWSSVVGPDGNGEPGSTQAFPDGFQMIADQLDTDGVPDPRARAKFLCADPYECEREDSCEAGPHQTQDLLDTEKTFPTSACGELELKLVFPTCSDGRLDSPNHRDHVAYDDRADCSGEIEGVDDFENSLCGACPDTHPIRLPEIQLYIRIFNYEGGQYIFSNGLGSVHSDYMSGWDAERLQVVLDECENESEAASPDAWCEATDTNPNGLTFRDVPKTKGDTRIECMLDQLQPETPIDTTIITPEAVDGVTTLPTGACLGDVLWENQGLSDSGAQACPEHMSTADPTSCAVDEEDEDEGEGDDEDEDGDGDDEDAGGVDVMYIGIAAGGGALFALAVAGLVMTVRRRAPKDSGNLQIPGAGV